MSMKSLIITLSISVVFLQHVKSMQPEDSIITYYLEKVGYEALANKSSYVYCSKSYNKYNANLLFNDKKEIKRILLYKKNKSDTLYRMESNGNIELIQISIWSRHHSKLNFIKDGNIKSIIDRGEDRRRYFVSFENPNYTFNIIYQIKKASDENRLKYEGEEMFNEMPCYKFLLINDVVDKYMYFEKDTYLLAGSIHYNESKIHVGTYDEHKRIYIDYIKKEGVFIPKEITTYKNGNFWDSFIFENLKFNVKLDNDIFYDALNKSEYSFK